jgi:hypothetical protein
MQLDISEDKTLILSDVFSGIGIKTDVGVFYFCQRDGGIEMRLNDGPWYSWQDPRGPWKVGGSK